MATDPSDEGPITGEPQRRMSNHEIHVANLPLRNIRFFGNNRPYTAGYEHEITTDIEINYHNAAQ